MCSNIYEPRVALRRWERVGGGAARARDFIEARFINATRVIVTETADRNGEKLVLQFDPTPAQQMLVACLWSRTPIPGEPDLWSFSAITDEPPPEVAAAGHDRCIVPIKPENVDTRLNPNLSDLAAQYAILDDRERPYYEHWMAA